MSSESEFGQDWDLFIFKWNQKNNKIKISIDCRNCMDMNVIPNDLRY